MYLVHRGLPPEVRDGVSASQQLPKAGVRRKQPLGRQHPRKLLVGHYELVARIEVLWNRVFTGRGEGCGCRDKGAGEGRRVQANRELAYFQKKACEERMSRASYVVRRKKAPGSCGSQRAMDEIFPTPPFSVLTPFSGLTLFLLWSNRALKVGPRCVQ